MSEQDNLCRRCGKSPVQVEYTADGPDATGTIPVARFCFPCGCAVLVGAVKHQCREVCTLNERIAALEAGLRPFAEFSAECWRDVKDAELIGLTCGTRVKIPTVGDCRRAAALLEEKK